MGRKLEFCREQALRTAMESFWSQGYDNTSMRDLAAKLNLHLGSVYNALGDKEKVFEAALRLHLQDHSYPELDRLEKSEDPLAALGAYLHKVVEECSGAKPSPGCFIFNSLRDITNINASITALLNDYLVRLEKALTVCLQNAQDKGQLPAERDMAPYARFILAASFSIRTMAKLNTPAAHLMDVKDCTLRALAA